MLDTVVLDPVRLEAKGRLLPLGNVASVLGENLGIVGERVLDGSLTAPMSGSGLEEPEGLESLARVPDTIGTGEGDVDPETGGNGREGLEGGELADVELLVELELSETDPPTVTGILDEEVGREDDGPVGGELNDVETDKEDELFVVMLIGPTITEPELEELPVG